MKSRPRRIENRVAEELNARLFVPSGMTPVERIPVLGRTGPDLSINESTLAIDVKSRLEVPALLRRDDIVVRPPGVLCAPIKYIMGIFELVPTSEQDTSVTVVNWLEHMTEWTDKNSGIPALVCHKSSPISSRNRLSRNQSHVANATFVIWHHDLPKLKSIFLEVLDGKKNV